MSLWIGLVPENQECFTTALAGTEVSVKSHKQAELALL